MTNEEMLFLSAKELRQVQAAAWDEGFDDGKRYAFEGVDGPKFHNPYREGS